MRVSNNPLHNSHYNSNQVGSSILFFIFALFSPLFFISLIVQILSIF